jgi:hypothetical protein
MPGTELAVGERARDEAGVAIIASLTLVAVFAAVTWWTKETPGLDLHQPWQDDPYDVLVSLDFVVLPLLVAAGAWRAQLCRRYSTLPARRLVDLLRLCAAGIGVCLATELAEWVAVALGLHRPEWTAATAWQVAALAGLTAATLGVGVLVARAARRVGRVATAGAQPDWLADAVALGLRLSLLLGRHGAAARAALRWLDGGPIAWVRRRPIAAAALLSCGLALPYVAAKIALEGYPPALVLLSFALPAAGLYLRIVEPRQVEPPAWLFATVTGCIAGVTAFAFHDSLLGHQTAAELNGLLFGGALVGAVAGSTLRLGLRRLHARTPTV